MWLTGRTVTAMNSPIIQQVTIRLLLLVAGLLMQAPAAWSGSSESCDTCHRDSHYLDRYPHIAVTQDDLRDTVHARHYCVDCHYEGFDDYPHDKLRHRANCAECHDQQRQEFHTSSHFKARQQGNLEAPNCTDCHGFHAIRQPAEQFKGANAVEVCAQCHGDESINSRFKLKSGILSGFNSSYHGQMYQLGFEGDRYATCVSCHDNHAVLGKDSPQSTIGKQKIIETCQQCHEEANENFVTYLTHYQPGDGEHPNIDKVFYAMELLLWGVMLVFGLHTFLWFVRTLVARGGVDVSRKRERGTTVRRFRGYHRVMHLVLVVSFLTLALTGLPVKFHDSAMAAWIAQNIIGFEMAALAHRVAGITLVALFFVHIGELAWRLIVYRDWGLLWGPRSLVPNLKDIKDFGHHILYFLFLSKDHPRFDRWTYWEKFDYLAVFWGMVVIGLSGLMLMLPLFATEHLPGWTINVAHIVHSEEALLATAFIFIVHFFNTHLRPTAFPLDDAIFTGHISLDQLQKERPLEYERLKKEGKLDALLVDPLPGWAITLMRLGGFAFVLIGIMLLVLILNNL